MKTRKKCISILIYLAIIIITILLIFANIILGIWFGILSLIYIANGTIQECINCVYNNLFKENDLE